MEHRMVGRRVARAILITGISLLAAACGDQFTGPSNRTELKPELSPSRDDTPPEIQCRSGWVEMDGRWECPG